MFYDAIKMAIIIRDICQNISFNSIKHRIIPSNFKTMKKYIGAWSVLLVSIVILLISSSVFNIYSSTSVRNMIKNGPGISKSNSFKVKNSINFLDFSSYFESKETYGTILSGLYFF